MSTARTPATTTAAPRTAAPRTAPSAAGTRPRPHTGTICTPWDGVRVRVQAPRSASFSDLPAPHGGVAPSAQQLRTPWDDADLVIVPVRSASFSALPAPVGPAPVPAQRPAVGDELFSGPC
jgi:hypothetical protein